MVVKRLRAKFRRRTTRRLGGVWKQKQTVNYYIDLVYGWQNLSNCINCNNFSYIMSVARDRSVVLDR